MTTVTNHMQDALDWVNKMRQENGCEQLTKLKRGVPKSPMSCPIALSLVDCYGESVRINYSYNDSSQYTVLFCYKKDGKDHFVWAPKHVYDFTREFDRLEIRELIVPYYRANLPEVSDEA